MTTIWFKPKCATYVVCLPYAIPSWAISVFSSCSPHISQVYPRTSDHHADPRQSPNRLAVSAVVFSVIWTPESLFAHFRWTHFHRCHPGNRKETYIRTHINYIKYIQIFWHMPSCSSGGKRKQDFLNMIVIKCISMQMLITYNLHSDIN